MYSSSAQLSYRFRNGNTEALLFKHVMMMGLGLFMMVYVHSVKYKIFSRLSQIGVVASAVLLFLTLLMGTNVNSASRWFMGFQPSDLAKLSLIVYVARSLSLNRDKLNDFKQGVLPIMIPVGLICGLILPANFSTSAMLFVDCLVLMFVGSVPLKHIGLIMASAIAAFGLLLLLSLAAPKLLPRAKTWTSRLMTWTGDVDKSQLADKNYQSNLAKSAIDRGGFFGKGPGKGTTKHILPSAWADFIFVSFIEEYGSLFGGFGLLLLYLIFLFRIIRISIKSESSFGSLMAFGLGFSIVFQAFINMGVAVSIFPVTGQPLPLISMGGTSLVFTCITIGMILSVSRTVYNKEEGGVYE